MSAASEFGKPPRQSATVERRLLEAFSRTSIGTARRVTGIRIRRGRSPSALLTLADGERFFVKQEQSAERILLKREAMLLSGLNDIHFSPASIPPLIKYDAETGLIITKAFSGYVPLDRRLAKTSMADYSCAVSVAQALACVHSIDVQILNVALEPVGFPWTLSLLTPGDLVRRPADYGVIAAAFERSHCNTQQFVSKWNDSHLIHADFKADNILYLVDRHLDQCFPITIVDWEMAGIGDPLWDVGSYIGSILFNWIRVMLPQAVNTAALANPKANCLRRHIGYFLISYRHFANISVPLPDDYVFKALQYAGIFLLHRVAVGLEFTGTLDPLGLLLLDSAGTLMNHPERAASALRLDSLL